MPEKPVLRLGPFLGADFTTVGPYDDSNGIERATLAKNCDPTRYSGGLTTARGRVNIGSIVDPANTISAIAPFNGPSHRYVIGSMSNKVVAYDTDTVAQADVANAVAFTSAVQFGSTMFTNSGQQFNMDTVNFPQSSAAKWQYQVSDNGGITYSVSNSGGLTFPQYTYYYAFTITVRPPKTTWGSFNGVQESSPIGAILQTGTSQYPYQVTINAVSQSPVIAASSGNTWSGTMADGTTWFTNIYRQSTGLPVWYLVATALPIAPGVNAIQSLANGNVFADLLLDPPNVQNPTGNPPLVLYHDPPPASSSTTSAIFSHKERMWCFSLVSNAATNNIAQCQLWYSDYGLPWSFNAALQVLLVGQSDTPNSAVAAGSMDYPQAGVPLSSLGVLFKRKTIWLLYGDDPTTFFVRKVADLGLLAPKSWAVCQGVIFFLSEEGVYSFDGNAAPQYVSERFRGALEAIPVSDRQAAVGWFADRSYWISFPATQVTYRYHLPTQEWIGPLPYATTSAFSVPADNPPAINGALQRLNEVIATRSPAALALDAWGASDTSDLGANIVSTWTGPLTDSGMPRTQKSYDFLTINAPIQPGVTATVTLTVDPGSTPAKVFTRAFNLGVAPTQTVTIIPSTGTQLLGYLAQLSVQLTTAAGASAPSQIYSVEAHTNPIAPTKRSTDAHDTLLAGWYVDDSDIGQAALATWTSPITTSGQPRIQKSYDFVMLNAPVQTGTATVVVTVDPGTPLAKTSTVSFNLANGPTQTLTLTKANGAPILGYSAQVALTLTGGSPNFVNSIELHADPASPTRVASGAIPRSLQPPGIRLASWTVADSDLGQSAVGTWTSPLVNAGSSMTQKQYQSVVVTAPVQPFGTYARVTLVVDPGSTPGKTWTAYFDLSKGPTNVGTVGDINGPLNGFLEQVSVTLINVAGATNPAEVFSVELYGLPQTEMVPFDNGAVTP